MILNWSKIKAGKQREITVDAKYKYMKGCFLLLTLSLGHLTGLAQVNIDSLCILGICTPTGYAIPGIDGMPRPKGVKYYQERTPTYQIKSTFKTIDSTISNDIQRTSSWWVKLRAPIILKDHFKLLVGLQYYQQELYFKDPDALNNAFHQSLEDKAIRSAGVSFNAFKSYIGNKYLVGRVTLRLNGDFDNGDLRHHLKSSYSVLYGIKKSVRKTWGFGASYSNSFGRSSIYPILFLNNKFKKKWAFRALLPVSTQLIYMPNDKNTLYFTNKLEGDNYNLNFESLQPNRLYLEKADFKSFFTYEREIYDFIWFGVSTGMQFNINYDLSDSDLYFNRVSNATSDHTVIANELTPTPFLRIGLFLVPPRGWGD
ncbi:MAG: hypothetical protein ACI9JN_001340 [Bacteroidia bacterium]|jgi:hypothetical protein